jgi:hypothetical protein
MISRRKFFKIAGLSTVAIGAGFTTGKLTGNNKSVSYTVHGFIPADEQVINSLVSAFRNKIKSNSSPVVIADSKVGEVINKSDLLVRKDNFSNSGSITYRIKRLDKQVDSDIIFSDGNTSVYSIDELNISLFNLRNKLKNKKADYLFTAEYTETNFLSSILRSDKKEVVIENEKGLVEKIPLDKNYQNILVDGPLGKTGLKIENGIVRVHSSSCKNGICKHSIAGSAGNIIACAPNKILVRVVNA